MHSDHTRENQSITEANRSTICVKRVYEPSTAEDGVRILVDRLWPRGVSKEQAAIDEWMKAIAPSPELRTWFGHRPERFAAFVERYERELLEDPTRCELADRLVNFALHRKITLLYAAKDPVHNHAMVLRDWLQRLITANHKRG